MKTPEIEVITEGRLRLRRLDLTDVDPLFAAIRASIGTLSAWMPWAHAAYSREDACFFVASTWLRWREGTAHEFLIEDAVDGRFLGMCGLNEISRLNRSANIGYWVKTGEDGRGVCTAAARLVAHFGFAQVGLQRIRLFHMVGNRASQRVAEKVGFRLEGVQRQHTVLHGQSQDTLLYALVSPDEILP